MKEEYDFSAGRKNPYASKLKQPVTLRLDGEIIAYFEKRAKFAGVPYQTLIEQYLAECATGKRSVSHSPDAQTGK